MIFLHSNLLDRSLLEAGVHDAFVSTAWFRLEPVSKSLCLSSGKLFFHGFLPVQSGSWAAEYSYTATTPGLGTCSPRRGDFATLSTT